MPKDAQGRHLARKGGGLVEFLVILLIAFALVFGFVRPFVIEAFYIPSKSMVPTLEVGDRVFVNKFIYRFHEPKRDDIIVFKSIGDSTEGGQEDLIKRVVGLPGDEISVQDGVLFVNVESQQPPYAKPRPPATRSRAPTTAPNCKLTLTS